MSLLQEIKNLASSFSEEIINNRHYLHANPELSYQEYNTAKYVAKQLRSYGIEPTEGVAETGLTATIEGRNP
ncbi:MAG: amidohydrolase, partial [Cyclobacteriaceae bacterium]|nr:amidohydrolase [Cyclobacteriaceae bacterium]